MTLKRPVKKANALDKIFQQNEYDLIRAAKIQSDYDDLYDDIDAQENFSQQAKEFYTFYAMHFLQHKFRDAFIQLMKNKDLAEQLTQFNIFIQNKTDEANVGESVASQLESVANYLPFGQQAVAPITGAIRKVSDKLGEKNVSMREEQKSAAMAAVGGSAKPPYEVILRLCATALADSCENLLLLMDNPDDELKPVMDYLVNDRMKHALQKKIWTLETDQKSSPVINLARNIFFSVHIPEKTGGVRLGMKNLIGGSYKGPTVKMGGYTVQLEKYLRREFISFNGTLYIPLKKKEAALKKLDKADMFKSIGAELLILQLAEGGRVISSDEKAALDVAFFKTKRGFSKTTPDEIKLWIAEKSDFIKKLSGKKPSSLTLNERLHLIEQKIAEVKQQMQQRQASSIHRVAQEKLQKHKSKIYDAASHIDTVCKKLSGLITGLQLGENRAAENKFSLQGKLDLKWVSTLSANSLLVNTQHLVSHYKKLDISDEAQIGTIKHNLAVLKQALLFKILDSLPACFTVQKLENDDLIWQPKRYEKQSRIEEIDNFKKALLYLDISLSDKKSWVEFLVLELQERINQCLSNADEKIKQGRDMRVELEEKNNPDALKKMNDFNQQIILYRDYLNVLQKDLRGLALNDFNIDENLISLKNLRAQVTSLESCLMAPSLDDNLTLAKTASVLPTVSKQPVRSFRVIIEPASFLERLVTNVINRIKAIFGFTTQYVKNNPGKSAVYGTVAVVGGGVVGAAACVTTTAVLIKMGVAAKVAKVAIATKTIAECSIAGAAVGEAALVNAMTPRANQNPQNTPQENKPDEPQPPMRGPGMR